MNPFPNFPEFDVADWTRLDLAKIPADRVTAFINHCLADKEFRCLMMHQYGSLVLGASRNLLKRTQSELLAPLGYLSRMMDDDDPTPDIDWSDLKRDQRARILREYWERVRHRKHRMQELAKLFSRGRADPHYEPITGTHILSSFAEPFSAHAQTRTEFHAQLKELSRAGLSKLLPWRQILSQQINEGTRTLADLSSVIPDRRQDIALKFQFLMELAHHQHIKLHQEQAFGEIELAPNSPEPDFHLDSHLTIKHDHGQETLDWDDLNQRQRQKVLKDLQSNKVVLI